VTDLSELVRARAAERVAAGKSPTKADLLWLEATAERSPVSSVEISRNAKGEMQWTIKIADADPHEALTTAKRYADHLRAVYPMANGTVGSPSKDEPAPKPKEPK
jgi:phage terminase small subunit